jgi:competence protein ComEA
MTKCRWILGTMLALTCALAVAAPPPAHAAEKGAPGAEATKAAAAAVDVNTATIEELVKVPGIGDALAARIVEFRTKNGPFERVDDLLKVRGIGEKSLEKLRPHLRAGARK